MARFDVYANPDAERRPVIPFLLDVQCTLLETLDSRVVVPLRRLDRFAKVSLPRNLAPVLDVDGVRCFMETPKLAAVPSRLLKDKVASLTGQHDEITGALDFLFQGF